MSKIKEIDPSTDHGFHAESPHQIPFKGWIQIGKRILKNIKTDHVQIVSAGVAFYIFLGLFAAIAALVSIYGLVMDPQQVQDQMAQLTSVLPAEAREIITQRLGNVADKPEDALGFGVLFSILLSIWSSNKGTKAMFQGISIVYNENNTRNFFKETGITLLFTLIGVVLGVITLSLIIGFPALEDRLGLPEFIITIISYGRWLLLGLVIAFFVSALYKYAPMRRDPKFRWVSHGAIITTVLWLAGSWVFSYFVDNLANFDKTYGPMAGVAILMLWFFLTSFLILLGAEINSESEFQTSKDTTIGKDRPMGERDAYFADKVFKKQQKD